MICACRLCFVCTAALLTSAAAAAVRHNSQGGVWHPVHAAAWRLPSSGGSMASGGCMALRQHACTLWQACPGSGIHGGKAQLSNQPGTAVLTF
jgi:hypothetical protein